MFKASVVSLLILFSTFMPVYTVNQITQIKDAVIFTSFISIHIGMNYFFKSNTVFLFSLRPR